MNILMVASEMVPLLRTGDVATVVMGLSQSLRKQGHDVRIILPLYCTLHLSNKTPSLLIDAFDVPLGDHTSKARLFRFDCEGLPVYLIENQVYFGREHPYGYLDDYERFTFFTRAIMEMLQHTNFATENWYPDVLHGHDWIAGLLPLWMRFTYKDFFVQHPSAFVFTIHNANSPGIFGYRALNLAGLTNLPILQVMRDSQHSISFLTCGVLAADAVNTVSQQHAYEILHESSTQELAQILHGSQKPLDGILNGLDYLAYNPAFDDIITHRYDRDRIHLRLDNKRVLQEECGLSVDPAIALLGFISRLIPEKGTDLIDAILAPLLAKEHVQIIIVGNAGDYHYRESFTHLQQKYSTQFAPFFTALDDPLSRKLLAAADSMLIPSLREPCGLQQMLSMRYGAVPIVHHTGGLADTVAPWNERGTSIKGLGFVFDAPKADKFFNAIKTALHIYYTDQQTWQELQHHNMMVEFSWSRAARSYVKLYTRASQVNHVPTTLSPDLTQENTQPLLPNRWDLLVQAMLESGELATSVVHQRDYLRQAARNIRDLLSCDAVLIWVPNETDVQLFHPLGHSFRHNGKPFTFDPSQYQSFSERDSRSWQYLYSLIPKKGISNSDSSFLNSKLAQQQKWLTQLTVPIRTHGMFLGHIDVFTCSREQDFSDQDRNILRAFAQAFAINLERTRLKEITDRLLAADRDIASLQTVEDIAHCVLTYANSLLHAPFCSLQLQSQNDTHRSYTLEDGTHFSISPLTRDAQQDRIEAAITPFHKWSSNISTRLVNTSGQIVGILTVSSPRALAFSQSDQETLQALGQQATIFLYSALLREKEDNSRVERLRKLANSLFGGVDFNTLLQNVLATIAEVLQSKAASLYLVNEEQQKVVEIRAAYGTHEPLLQQKAQYQIGQGVTGGIALKGETVRADSPEQLRAHPYWIGKHKHLHGNVDPNAFLGIPLKATDLVNPERQVIIGVLKLEDRQDNTTFTTQDERLGEMMANMIATVIQNERLSNTRLRELNANLEQLSKAMVGGLEMSVLVQRIVDTIATVVGAEASSLYLLEPGSDVLSIRAATGYQAALVQAKTQYDLHGSGITAWIAREGKPFNAKSASEILTHPAWAGKYKHLHGNVDPNAFLGIPLKVIATGGREEVIGVLKVEGVQPGSRHPEEYFTDQDQLLMEMMGNVIATVIQNTYLSDMRLRELNADLRAFSGAMVGGLEMSALVQRIVTTIAMVVEAEASSLYLLEPGSDVLSIRAATGYQAALVQAKTQYDLHGSGITAWIAYEGKPFNAKSAEEIQKHSAWAGRYKHLHGGVDPNAFLGIPLKVIATGGREEILGVLKVEGVRSSNRHPEAYFTDQDQLLMEMMGNVIATVIQNTYLSDMRLRELNADLRAFSGAMAGGLEMSALVQRIVTTIAAVVGAEASALYLLEPGSDVLSIRAATGYQEALVQAKTQYDLHGPGITASIAREGKLFNAKSASEILTHPAWAGKYKHLHGNVDPNAFLGIPLKVIATGGREEVIGVLKVEGVRPSGKHPEAYFTDQDQLLMEMMGNVIATVIQNTRLSDTHLYEVRRAVVECIKSAINIAQPSGDTRIEELVKQMIDNVMRIFGQQATLDTLQDFVHKTDTLTLNALSHTLLNALPHKDDVGVQYYLKVLLDQTQALLGLNPASELFEKLSYSRDEVASHWYDTVYQLYRSDTTNRARLLDALKLAPLWQEGRDLTHQPLSERFNQIIRELATALASIANKEVILVAESGLWMALKLPDIITFTELDLPKHLTLLFYRGSQLPAQDDVYSLNLLLQQLQQRGLGHIVSLICFLPEIDEAPFASRLRQEMQKQFVDSLFFTLKDVQHIVCATNPRKLLVGLMLKQVNLLTISPYKISGPTDSKMFYGRVAELREITEHVTSKSYAIIGGRRVGKSSLLIRLHRHNLPVAGIQSLYHDCSTTTSYQAFLQSPISSWSAKETNGNLPATFEQLLLEPPKDKPLVLLLDEADKLVHIDQQNGWPLFNKLRSLMHADMCNVVLSGERTLRAALLDQNSPFFNFAEPKILGPLDYPAVEELITSPMKELEIKLIEESAIVQLIWDVTWGHPNVAQRMCSRLIGRLNGQGKRQLMVEDVNEVLNTLEFQDEDFLSTYWEQATELEKLITLLMTTREQPYYTIINMLDLLTANDISTDEQAIKEAFTDLEKLRSILVRSNRGYKFTFEFFPKVLINLGAEDLLRSYKKRYLATHKESYR